MLNVDRFMDKMNKWTFFLGVNFFLAVGIFLCALLGRSMGIQGPALAISVVWPATGLSLAALLLFGYWAGIGVIIGNFAYNFLFLIIYPPAMYLTTLQMLVVASCISMGSFAQALFSAYIIRTYSTPLIFRTVQDVFIFLIPASMLSCLIGSTVGVTTLAIAGGVDKSLILPVYLTFWLGDTVGIYVITPLIVIWTLQPHRPFKFSDHISAIVCMLSLFVIFSFATCFFNYPLPHLFVPISIWAAYLFRMHGASLAIFLMTASSVAFATFHGFEGTSLISLITFIGVTIAASLIIAAVVNERAEAYSLLDIRNLYLEKEVDVKVRVLEEVRSEAHQKLKFTVQDPMPKLQTLEIHTFLNDINLATKNSQAVVEDFQKLLSEEKNLPSAEKKLYAGKLHQINKELSKTIHATKHIFENLNHKQL